MGQEVLTSLEIVQKSLEYCKVYRRANSIPSGSGESSQLENGGILYWAQFKCWQSTDDIRKHAFATQSHQVQPHFLPLIQTMNTGPQVPWVPHVVKDRIRSGTHVTALLMGAFEVTGCKGGSCNRIDWFLLGSLPQQSPQTPPCTTQIHLSFILTTLTLIAGNYGMDNPNCI